MKCLNCGVELGTGNGDRLCNMCRSERIAVSYNDYQKFREHVENPEISMNERLDKLIEKFQPQLSLRDYLAGQALVALMARRDYLFFTNNGSSDNSAHVSKFAYELADCMLQAREGEK